jgi:hypothetical protein
MYSKFESDTCFICLEPLTSQPFFAPECFHLLHLECAKSLKKCPMKCECNKY